MIVKESRSPLEMRAVAEVADEFRQELESDADSWIRPSVAPAVETAVLAFIEAGFRVEPAARRSAPGLMVVGRRAAARGHCAEQVRADFQRVAHGCVRRARPYLSRVGHPRAAAWIQHHLPPYLDRLLCAVLTGHRQVWPLLGMNVDQRRTAVVQALFGAEPVSMEVLRVGGIDVETEHVPIAWVHGNIHTIVGRGPNVLSSSNGTIALVPVGDMPRFEIGSDEQVVTGPVAPLPLVHEALALTRRAAAELRAGAIDCTGAVTSCEEIADQLAVTNSEALADILIDKYLAEFARLKPARRMALGRVLLTWLETRSSFAEVAEIHHLARQTAHDQVNAAKELIGDAIDEPAAHAAIVVALHAALSRWERDA